MPPTESGDPGPVTRIAEEFLRLQETGEGHDLDAFCARYPEPQRQRVREECEQLLRIHGAIGQRAPLVPGQVLASYEVLGLLGRGGMGEVYRARDTKLDREVAIKLLPPNLTGDRERLARFQGEAKALAALNHPNIAAIHGLEEADGVPFLVMELVEGQTLAGRLARGRLGLDEALRLTEQIARGLEAAHESGVIHRDLKPANVMVTDEGRVVVLDFGLAKRRAKGGVIAGADEDMTLPGMVLGTPAYMSPEQAEGKAVDRRTDIWSLGGILYESLTGKRPFPAGSTSETRTAIQQWELDLDGLPTGTPPRVRRLLGRTLQKDRDRRMRDAGDVMLELEEARAELGRGAPEPVASGWRSRYLLAVPFLAAGLAVGWGLATPAGGSLPLASKFTRLADLGAEVSRVSLSPDGRTVVYAARDGGDWDIFELRVGAFRPRNLTEAHASDDLQPAFSPDGERIAFRSDRNGGGIWTMTSTGESPLPITDRGYDPAWSPDGEQIVFSEEGITDPYYRRTMSRLWTVSLEDREVRALDLQGTNAVQPDWSPGGKRIAFWAHDEGGQRDIFTVSPMGGDVVPVTNDAATDWNPIWSPDGQHLFFCSDRGGSMNLWRVAVNEETGRVRGEPEPVTAGSSEFYLPAVSRATNRIAYVSLQRRKDLWRVGFDAAGGRIVEGTEEPITSGSVFINEPDLSPDGESFVYTATTGGREDLGLVRADGSDLSRLTDDEFKDRRPRWSSDGNWIAFYSNREGNYRIETMRPDGSDRRSLTLDRDNANAIPAWAPDGRLAYAFFKPDGGYAVAILDASNPAAEKDELPGLPSAGQRMEPVDWSPDGRYLAGDVFEQGFPPRVALFDLSERSYRIVTEFGRQPTWLSDGHRLLFVDRGRLHLLDTGSGVTERVLDISPDEFDHRVLLDPEEEILYFLRLSRGAELWMTEIE